MYKDKQITDWLPLTNDEVYSKKVEISDPLEKFKEHKKQYRKNVLKLIGGKNDKY